jgi:hypothetical protein
MFGDDDLKDIKCSHYLIGSSQIHELLKKKLTLNTAHRRLWTKEEVRVGRGAEFAAKEDMRGLIGTQGSYIVNKLPFIVFSTDYMHQDGYPVEVKYTTKMDIAGSLSSGEYEPATVQLSVAVEALGFDEGCLVTIHDLGASTAMHRTTIKSKNVLDRFELIPNYVSCILLPWFKKFHHSPLTDGAHISATRLIRELSEGRSGTRPHVGVKTECWNLFPPSVSWEPYPLFDLSSELMSRKLRRFAAIDPVYQKALVDKSNAVVVADDKSERISKKIEKKKKNKAAKKKKK